MHDLRSDFPIFKNRLEPDQMVYCDSAATSLKPYPVIRSVNRFYEECTSNVFRGNQVIAEEASTLFQEARQKVASFIGASAHEIVLTRGTTEALNLVAEGLRNSKGRPLHVVHSILEHHANLLPWRKEGRVEVLEIGSDGTISINHLDSLLQSKPDLLALTFASNVTGNIQPVQEAVALARAAGVMSLVDAAQIAAHERIDVRELGCDFLAFSAHKMFGPSGVGVLFVASDAIEMLRPTEWARDWGGGMVNQVTQTQVTLKPFPQCFEAGTPNIEGVFGLGAAVDYIEQVGFDTIHSIHQSLHDAFLQGFRSIPNCIFELAFPLSERRIPVFTLKIKPGISEFCGIHDIARMLGDEHRLMVNAGFQCAQPLYERFGLSGGIRISFSLYNTPEDVSRVIEGLSRVSVAMS